MLAAHKQMQQYANSMEDHSGEWSITLKDIKDITDSSLSAEALDLNIFTLKREQQSKTQLT